MCVICVQALRLDAPIDDRLWAASRHRALQQLARPPCAASGDSDRRAAADRLRRPVVRRRLPAVRAPRPTAAGARGGGTIGQDNETNDLIVSVRGGIDQERAQPSRGPSGCREAGPGAGGGPKKRTGCSRWKLHDQDAVSSRSTRAAPTPRTSLPRDPGRDAVCRPTTLLTADTL